MAASSLAGLALTYYYDNPRNVKLMNILKVRISLACAIFSAALPRPAFAECSGKLMSAHSAVGIEPAGSL